MYRCNKLFQPAKIQIIPHLINDVGQLLRRIRKYTGIQTCLLSKPLEFERVKIRIVIDRGMRSGGQVIELQMNQRPHDLLQDASGYTG